MKTLTGHELYNQYNKLCFNINDYFKYIKDEYPINSWHGFSIQQESFNLYEEKIGRLPLAELEQIIYNPPGFDHLIDNYIKLIKEIIDGNADNSNWIIAKDNNRKKWIYGPYMNLFYEDLWFHKNNIDSSFRGAFYVSYKELTRLLPNLLSYPCKYKQKDINLFSVKLDYIIRITNHFSIEIISQNENKLNEIKNSIKHYNHFKIIPYTKKNDS